MAFTIGICQRYDSLYLRVGRVGVKGFGIEYPAVPARDGGQPQPTSDPAYVPPASMFTAMATAPIYDVGEQAFSTYLQAVDRAKDLTAIPVFPSRFFPHSQIVVHKGARITTPADLPGKRVGIGSFAKNYAVWLRGVLGDQYAIPREDVIWVEDQPEHFADYHPPQRFQVKRLPEGQTSIQLLENGELDAVSMPRGPSRAGGQVRPLFENPYPHIEDYLQDHPFFPINTVLTLPRATVAKAPGLPAALLVAFQEALDLYRQEVRSGARDDEHSGLHILRL